RRGGARIDAGTRRGTRRHLHDHDTAGRRNARPRPAPSPRGVNEKPLRVLIADDHPLFRNGLRTLFETTPDIEVIDAVSDGAEVVRSEEHTSELQSLRHLVCRLLLEKKNKHTEPKQTVSA